MLTKKLAKEITGGLSDTSKMACLSYGLPAPQASLPREYVSCNIGAILAEKPGTICFDCYACKGSYSMYPAVLQAQIKRFLSTKNPLWVRAMATLIGSAEYFRWLDSGDIYSMEFFLKILEVARKTPDTKHWIPTREAKLIAEYLKNNELPKNVTIRISGSVYDRKPGLTRFRQGMESVQTSTVRKDKKVIGFECKAYRTEKTGKNDFQVLPLSEFKALTRADKKGRKFGFCGKCRACWDKSVDNVSYEAH